MIFYNLIISILSVLMVLYLFIVIILYNSLNNLKYPKVKSNPIISIIVSLHNEEKNVNQLISCLTQQEYPKDFFEIILVNDRSSDHTQNLLELAEKKYSSLIIIKNEKLQKNFSPKKYAIDTAIKAAKGEIILLTDADGRPGKKWIKSIVSLFSENTGMVIGNAPYIAETIPQKMMAMEYFSHATIAAASTGMSFPLTCVGTNMAYRKRIYESIGGFGEFKKVHSGDDDLFLQRVRDDSDWDIRYATSAESQVLNATPKSIKQFIHQRLRYASKGFKYPIKVTLSLAIYFFLNVLLFLLGILSISNIWLIKYFIVLILGKGFADFILLKKSAKILCTNLNFKLFPLVYLLHIPYVIFFGLMGNIKKYKWADVTH